MQQLHLTIDPVGWKANLSSLAVQSCCFDIISTVIHPLVWPLIENESRLDDPCRSSLTFFFFFFFSFFLFCFRFPFSVSVFVYDSFAFFRFLYLFRFVLSRDCWLLIGFWCHFVSFRVVSCRFVSCYVCWLVNLTSGDGPSTNADSRWTGWSTISKISRRLFATWSSTCWITTATVKSHHQKWYHHSIKIDCSSSPMTLPR